MKGFVACTQGKLKKLLGGPVLKMRALRTKHYNLCLPQVSEKGLVLFTHIFEVLPV